MKILRSVKDELHAILSGQFVLANCLLDVGCFESSFGKLLLPLIDAAPNGISSDVPVFAVIQATVSSRPRNNSIILPKCSIRGRRNARCGLGKMLLRRPGLYASH